MRPDPRPGGGTTPLLRSVVGSPGLGRPAAAQPASPQRNCPCPPPLLGMGGGGTYRRVWHLQGHFTQKTATDVRNVVYLQLTDCYLVRYHMHSLEFPWVITPQGTRFHRMNAH